MTRQAKAGGRKAAGNQPGTAFPRGLCLLAEMLTAGRDPTGDPAGLHRPQRKAQPVTVASYDVADADAMLAALDQARGTNDFAS